MIFSNRFDSTHRVYFDLIFYLGLSLYFLTIGSISLKSLFDQWKKGKQFWLPVLYTLIGIIIAFGIGSVISSLFPNIDDGMGVFRVVNIPTLLAFAITTIVLPPIAEEAFYRKGIINFDKKTSLLLTTIIGIFLYATEHSLKPLGLLIVIIWSIPFTMSYIKTKNVYISMTSHFICNLLFNGATVILMTINFFKA